MKLTATTASSGTSKKSSTQPIAGPVVETARANSWRGVRCSPSSTLARLVIEHDQSVRRQTGESLLAWVEGLGGHVRVHHLGPEPLCPSREFVVIFRTDIGQLPDANPDAVLAQVVRAGRPELHFLGTNGQGE